MRKLVVVPAVIFGLVTAFVTVSPAAVTQSVSGTATGSTVVSLGANQSVMAVSDETYSSQGPLGSGTLHLEYVVTCCDSSFFVTFNGTAHLTRADGATLTGTMTGRAAPLGEPSAWSLVLTAGGGSLTGATANLEFTGNQHFTGSTATDSFAFTGTVTLPNPKTKDDCKKGSWRNLVDDQGRSFPSEGQCVSWAVHHAG